MKFQVSSSVLLKELNSIKGLVPSSPIIPILENFLFDIDGSSLRVTASDLQTTMSLDIEIDSNNDGQIAIPARMLLETLRNLPEQPVSFEIDDNYIITITSDTGRYQIAGEDGSDFPQAPNVKAENKLSLPVDVLANALNYTLFAVSTDEMKLAMNGVFVELTPENITFVATDAHRLVRYRSDVVKAQSATSIIIPGKALEQLKHALPSQNIDVNMEFNESNAVFAFNNIRMICRLIDERFPEYQNVIPTNNDKRLIVNRNTMASTLKRIVIYANKTTNQIRLKMEGRELQIRAEDVDFSNEAVENIYCEYDSEETLEIGFNAKFIQEMLGNIHCEEIEFELSEPNRAAVLHPRDQQADENLLMLVMPVMLNNYV
jgi:DNA polymerase-3 subunit beta